MELDYNANNCGKRTKNVVICENRDLQINQTENVGVLYNRTHNNNQKYNENENKNSKRTLARISMPKKSWEIYNNKNSCQKKIGSELL